MKLIISTHFFFLSKIVKAFLLIKCHAKGFARERGIEFNDSTFQDKALFESPSNLIRSELSFLNVNFGSQVYS